MLTTVSYIGRLFICYIGQRYIRIILSTHMPRKHPYLQNILNAKKCLWQIWDLKIPQRTIANFPGVEWPLQVKAVMLCGFLKKSLSIYSFFQSYLLAWYIFDWLWLFNKSDRKVVNTCWLLFICTIDYPAFDGWTIVNHGFN